MPPLKLDTELLQAALQGLEARRSDLEQKIAELRRALGSPGRSKPAASAAAAPRKRVLSPAARARISAAARKRWIEYRKANKSDQGA